MILNMNGGGATLNFRVVGGTTAPANPKENTIWINTATPITSYIFSAAEPSSVENGMVWISVGNASNVAFPATKKNPIMVYPLYSKQYVSGAWASVTAMTYQENWKEWSRYLVSASGIAPELGSMKVYGESGVSMSITPISSGGISIKRTVSNISGYVSAFSTNAIDVSEFKTMRIRTGNVVSQYVSVGIHASNTVVTSSYTRSVALSPNTVSVLDISDLNGKFYLAFGFNFPGIDMSAELLEITLEY